MTTIYSAQSEVSPKSCRVEARKAAVAAVEPMHPLLPPLGGFTPTFTLPRDQAGQHTVVCRICAELRSNVGP
jgi:hypothetical protein